MMVSNIFRIAVRSLLAHRLRTSLAILGIVIGTASVIAMLAVGSGAQRSIIGSISSMGTNLVVVRPGQARQRGVSTGTVVQNLTVEDALAIVRRVTQVDVASPVVQGNVQAKFKSKNTRTSLTGCAPTYFAIRNHDISVGRLFTDSDIRGRRKVAILGPVVAQNLFGSRNPLGSYIKVNGRSFLVIGLTKAKGDQGWFSPDDTIFVPYSTAMTSVLGLDYLRQIDVQVRDEASLDGAIAKMEAVLRQQHKLLPGTAERVNEMVERGRADLVRSEGSLSG
jgi:putative ABC transport system permease protein